MCKSKDGIQVEKPALSHASTTYIYCLQTLKSKQSTHYNTKLFRLPCYNRLCSTLRHAIHLSYTSMACVQQETALVSFKTCPTTDEHKQRYSLRLNLFAFCVWMQICKLIKFSIWIKNSKYNNNFSSVRGLCERVLALWVFLFSQQKKKKTIK